MIALRRLTVGVMFVTLVALATNANAQALKQLPPNAWVVIKINNPQNVNQKFAAFAEKIGITKLDPRMADPLTWALGELKIKQGLDLKGELAVGLYEPAGGNEEPRFVAVVPVSDYKAFLGNMKNVKTEGQVSTFNPPEDEDIQVFAANYGSFAVISMNKDLITQQPAGMDVAGLSRKQLDSSDVAVYANIKAIAAKTLPEYQKSKGEILSEVERDLQREQGFDQKFTPVVKALVAQLLDLGEGALQSGRGATLGLSVAKEGVSSALAMDFDPESRAGQTIAKCRNTDGDLIVGLPAWKYFAFGGAVLDRELSAKIFDELLGPVPAELAKVGEPGKPFMDAIKSAREMLAATNSMAFGYAAPTAEPGKQAAVQKIAVYQGDAKKMADAQRAMLAALGEMLKMLPKEAAGMINFQLQQGAKTVDGTSLDRFALTMKIDENTPEGAQIQQMMTMMYGANGMSGYMGAVNDKTYVMVMGPDELLNAVVASAKKNETVVGQDAATKAVAAKLPQKRAVVYYIALDNILNSVVQYANQAGLNVQLKFPADQPPIGLSIGSEGPAIRVDSYISSDLIENVVAAVLNVMMGGGNKPAGGGL